MYACITESHCCTLETNNIVNQLYFNKISKKKKKNSVQGGGGEQSSPMWE